MPGPIEFDVRADASQARRELSTVERAYSRLGSGVRRGAAVAAAGVGVVAAATAKLGVDSVKAASDSQQSIGATRSVYGRYAAQVIADSRRASQAVGLSATEYRELANVTGASLSAAGVPLGKVTDLTAKLNERAADVSATFGGPARDAVAAFSSLLRGEADPVERYGVSIKQSDVNARLAAKGLDKLEGSAAKQAEMQERLALLFEQTESSSGAFRRESNTLAGQQQRLAASFEDTKAKVGGALIPALTDATGYLNREAIPAVESYWRTFERDGLDGVIRRVDDLVGGQGDLVDVADEVERSASAVWRIVKRLGPAFADAAGELPPLLSPLKAVDTVLGALATILEQVPDDVLELGIQAGVAALVLPRLQGAVTATTGAMTAGARSAAIYYEVLRGGTATTAAATAAQARLATAVRTTAGIGGMLALTQAMQATNAESSDLEKGLGAVGTVAGTAALGFSVGGPWGAAAGLVAGVGLATYDLADAQNKSEAAARDHERAQYAARAALLEGKNTAAEYRDTLDQLTGATTRATRERILADAQSSGALALTQRLGIAGRDLIGSVLGQEGATRRLTAAMNANRGSLTGPEQTQLNAWLRRNAGEFARQQDAVRGAARDLRTWRQATRGLPPEVVTELKQIGAEISWRELRRLKRQYDLNPKQVETIIRAVGTETTLRKVDGVWRLMKDGRPTNVNLAPWLSSLADGLDGARRRTRSQVGNIDELLGGAGAPANMTPFTSSISGGLDQARGTARSGAPSVGAALSEGVAAGVRARAAAIAAEARGAVAAAVAAAQAAARSNSPSRETFEKVGVPLADGVTAGIKAGTPTAKRQARSLIAQVIAAAQTGDVDRIRDRITSLIEQRVNLKDDRAERRREAAIARGLRDRYRLLEQNARAQDRLGRQLDAARDKHKRLVDAAKSYAAGIKSTVVAFGSVVGLGAVTEGAPEGTVSLAAMLDELRDREAKARRFNELLTQLAEDGLSRTAVEQIREAGPAALGTLEAINTGGAAALAEVNRLTASIARSGSQLGASLASQYHDAGIQAAAGVVRGLEAQSRQLDRAASRLARALVRAVRRELGISSPSRVFRALGGETVRGLELGLDDTRARSAGARLAVGVKAGYGRPQLTTSIAGAGAGGVQTVRVVLTADVVDQLRAGKAVSIDVDVARAAGVRKLAVGGVR